MLMLDVLTVVGIGLLLTPVGWAIIYAVLKAVFSPDPPYPPHGGSVREQEQRFRDS